MRVSRAPRVIVRKEVHIKNLLYSIGKEHNIARTARLSKLHQDDVSYVYKKWGHEACFLETYNHDNPRRCLMITLDPLKQFQMQYSSLDPLGSDNNK